MSWNLLVWRWSGDFDTAAKRKRHKLKTSDVTHGFADNGDHPGIGEADMSAYLAKVFEEFGPESYELPFLVERYDKCVVFNYGGGVRYEIVPILGKLAMPMGFNAAEF